MFRVFIIFAWAVLLVILLYLWAEIREIAMIVIGDLSEFSGGGAEGAGERAAEKPGGNGGEKSGAGKKDQRHDFECVGGTGAGRGADRIFGITVTSIFS